MSTKDLVWDFTPKTPPSPQKPPPASSGSNGTDSSSTRDPSPGSNGSHGLHGAHGQNGYDASPHSFHLTQRACTSVSDSSHHSLLVNSTPVSLHNGQRLKIINNGGNGSRGAPGGDAGDGGRGGHGGVWKRSRKAPLIYRQGAPGGDGGDSGRGGNGGDGGSSNNVRLSSSDSRLFLLVDVHLRPGRGACGGAPGKKGKGGSGGSNPKVPGKNLSKVAPSGKDGIYASRGHSGKDGHNNGRVSFTVVDETGNELETSDTIFHLYIENFTISAVDDDGVFEPGEELMVNQIQLCNTGGLTIPPGCILCLKPSRFIKNSTQIELPKILPHQTIQIASKICFTIESREKIRQHQLSEGIIEDFVSFQPFDFSLSLHAYFENFQEYAFLSQVQQSIRIQYPVSISEVRCEKTVGRGCETVFRVGLQNLSSRSFGRRHGEAFNVVYKLFLGDDTHFLSNDHRDDTFYVEDLPPNGELVYFEHRIITGTRLPFYSTSYIQIDLLIRQELTERKTHTLKIVPLFRPDLIDRMDVLFFTDNTFTANRFQYFDQVFDLLNLVVNYFDVDHYENQGLEQQPLQYGNFSKKLIIVPGSSHEDFYLRRLNQHHVTSHLLSNQESAVLVVGPKMPERRRLFQYFMGESVRPLSPNEFSDYYLIHNPSEKDMEEHLEEIEYREWYKSGGKSSFVVNSHFLPEKIPGGWVRWKYCFDKCASVHRLAIGEEHRLLFHNSRNLLHSEGIIDRGLTFQVMSGLPFKRRIQLIEDNFFGEGIPAPEIRQMLFSSIVEDVRRLIVNKKVEKQVSCIEYLIQLHPHNSVVRIITRLLHGHVLNKRASALYRDKLNDLYQSSPDGPDLEISTGLSPNYLVDLLEKNTSEKMERKYKSRRSRWIFAGVSLAIGSLIGIFVLKRRR